MIRPANPDDAQAICAIYNHYIQHSIITFETDAVSGDDMRQRINSKSLKHPWLVYEKDQAVVGYAYASPWQSRCAYRFSVETTIYVSEQHRGAGIGTTLYQALIAELNKNDYHSLLAAIALPNQDSVALHEKLGFEKVGQFKQVGYKFDTWIDVGYWELILSA